MVNVVIVKCGRETDRLMRGRLQGNDFLQMELELADVWALGQFDVDHDVAITVAKAGACEPVLDPQDLELALVVDQHLDRDGIPLHRIEHALVSYHVDDATMVVVVVAFHLLVYPPLLFQWTLLDAW